MDSGDLEREKGITILAKNTAIHYAGPAAGRQADDDQHHRHPRPRRLRWRGRARPVDGRRHRAAGRRLRGPAAADPLRAAQGAQRRHAGDPRGQQDRPRATPASPRSSTRPTSCSWTCSTSTTARTRSTSRSSTPPAEGRPRRRWSMPENGGLPDSPDLEPLFQTILETIPAPTYDEDAPLQAHVTNLDASPVPRPARAAPRPRGHPEEGPARSPGCSATARSRTSRSPSCSSPRRLERKPGESAGPGDIVAIAGIPDIMIGETLADPENPVALPLITRRRAGDLDDDRHQHLAAGRPRPDQGHQGHRPPGQGPPRHRAGRQRVAARAADRAPRRLGGAGPRRAGAGDPGRADAPRGLRADRRQAAGGHQGDRRQGPRAGRAPDHRRAGGVPRRDHPAAGRPQGPHGADDQPRHRLGADGVPGPGARPDRLPHRVPHRDPRHRHRPPRLRGLRAVGRRDPLAARTARWSPTAPAPPRRTP